MSPKTVSSVDILHKNTRKLCMILADPTRENQLMGDCALEVSEWIPIIKLAQQHKLIPALFAQVREKKYDLPADAAILLRKQYEEKVFGSMAYAGLLARISREFCKKNIRLRVLKGPFLSQQVYGTLIGRQYSDLDLLVEEKNIVPSMEILQNLGFGNDQPYHSWNELQKKYYISHGKDIGFKNIQGLKIELHWKIFPENLTKESVFQDFFMDSHEIILSNERIYGFQKINQILYLAYHGYKHNWYRISWIWDVYNLLLNLREEERIVLIQKAHTIHIEKALNETLYLCHDLFNLNIKHFNIKGIKGKQVKGALISINRGKQDNSFQGIFRNQMHLLSLRRKFSYYLGSTRMLFNNDKDWQAVKLPAGLFPLYYLLHPFIWVKRKMNLPKGG